MTPQRLVYLWDADYPWDVRVEKICASATAAGYDVHIVARNRKWRPEVERIAEGTVHRMRPIRWLGQRADALLGFPAFFSPRWIGLLTRVVRETRPSVLIVRDMPLCPTAIYVGRRERVPVVLDMAENYPAMMRKNFEAGRQGPFDYLVRNPRVVAAVERYCLPRVARVLTVVEESAARVERLGVPASRVSVISNTPPCARLEDAPAPARVAGSPLRLVYMGLLEVPRGVAEMLDAIALLRQRGVAVVATIIGGGRDEALFHAQAAALGLGPDVVEFRGYIASHAEALRTVAAADIGVLPHRKSEAWDTTIPNKLFDYMAAGLPVITSDAAPFARIVRETGAGVVFVSRSAASLADAIAGLADPSRRAALAAAGRAAVAARYHWEHDEATLLRVLDEVAA